MAYCAVNDCIVLIDIAARETPRDRPSRIDHGRDAGLALFARVEARAASPLIQIAILRDPLLRARLAIGSLVSTVVMATLVVGPFYLSGALELGAARVGLVMSAGPLVAALTAPARESSK